MVFISVVRIPHCSLVNLFFCITHQWTIFQYEGASIHYVRGDKRFICTQHPTTPLPHPPTPSHSPRFYMIFYQNLDLFIFMQTILFDLIDLGTATCNNHASNFWI